MKTKIENISRYRTQIFAVAAILIAISHMNYNNELISIIASFGQIGVDIFLFLSGFGCFFSLYKNFNYKQFYFNRFKRLFPSYILIIGIYCIYNKFNIQYILRNFSLITFFTKGILTEWYIAGIIVLYLLTPILYNFLIKRKDQFIFLIVILILLSSISAFYLKDNLFIINEIFFTRIPIYLIGLLFAYIYLIENKKEIYISKLLFLFIGLTFCLMLFYHNINRWTLIRLTFIPTGLCLIFILSKFNLSFLNFIGESSLEIYLIFEKILPLIQNNIYALIITIIISYLIKKLFDFLKFLWYNIYTK